MPAYRGIVQVVTVVTVVTSNNSSGKECFTCIHENTWLLKLVRDLPAKLQRSFQPGGGAAMPLDVRTALTPPFASLAQLEEHRTFNARARSSSLRRRTTYVVCSSVGQNAGLWSRRSTVQIRSRIPYGRMPESGQKGRTVNPLVSACVDSNPTSHTMHFSPIILF